MRWLALWALLAGIYFALQAAIPLLLGKPWSFSGEDLSHLAAVPLAQLAALWVVAAVRRHSRQ